MRTCQHFLGPVIVSEHLPGPTEHTGDKAEGSVLLELTVPQGDRTMKASYIMSTIQVETSGVQRSEAF